MHRAHIRVGISGWTYPPWRGVFYPRGLAHRQELRFAAERLRTIEINGSFYALQRPASYQAWHDQVPAGFVFAVKAGRFITHLKRLRGVELPVANFFASGVLALGERLGPVLWQLPPNLGFDAATLEAFFALLPRSTTAAATLAARHDERLTGRALTTTDADRPLRHALEVRNPSFADPAFARLLRSSDVALVVADSAGKWPTFEHITADFVYVRLHGSTELYASGYGPAELRRWAAKARGWRDGSGCPDGRGRDVFVYFDNDVKAHAPFDAMALAELVADPPG